ncbi:hypothetical protein CTM89_20980, partial [Photobacterium leiognathi]
MQTIALARAQGGPLAKLVLGAPYVGPVVAAITAHLPLVNHTELTVIGQQYGDFIFDGALVYQPHRAGIKQRRLGVGQLRVRNAECAGIAAVAITERHGQRAKRLAVGAIVLDGADAEKRGVWVGGHHVTQAGKFGTRRVITDKNVGDGIAIRVGPLNLSAILRKQRRDRDDTGGRIRG